MTDARAVFHRFRAMPRSEQIATEYALGVISDWLRRVRPGRILEAGSGIGTITYLLATVSPQAEIVSIETDAAYCRAAQENLGALARRVTWLRNASEARGLFDFVVIDADLFSASDFRRLLAPRAIILAEGNRRRERAKLECALRTTN